jgi:hypothetical protein
LFNLGYFGCLGKPRDVRFVPQAESPESEWRKIARFRGDKDVDNGDNQQRLCCGNHDLNRAWENSSALASRTLLMAAIVACVVLAPLRAQAQWWNSKPADFEACADLAEKAATKEEKASRLGDCHSKFAGRRKPGGGYTYFDFMQNRHFDIAGPNPTPDEQRKIDEEYIAYLERERRSTIAAAFTAKQQQLQQASLKTDVEKIPVPRQNPARQPAAAAGEPRSGEVRSGDLRSRPKATNCARDSFSCEWPRLSEGIKDIKKLFSPSPNKAKRS